MSVDFALVDLLGGQFTALFAYIGPGADLGLISSAIGLLLTLGTSAAFMVLWPFRSLWRRLRGASKTANEDSPANSQP